MSTPSLSLLFVKAKNASYEAPLYAIFSSLLLLLPSYVQIFSSAPRSEAQFLFPAKFHSRTIQQIKWYKNNITVSYQNRSNDLVYIN
jgi:hypothetical protein